MIPHSALINALRDLGYVFKRQAPRVMIFKKKGGIDRVSIRRTQSHDPEAARLILRDAGMDPENIERFISTYSAANSGPAH